MAVTIKTALRNPDTPDTPIEQWGIVVLSRVREVVRVSQETGGTLQMELRFFPADLEGTAPPQGAETVDRERMARRVYSHGVFNRAKAEEQVNHVLDGFKREDNEPLVSYFERALAYHIAHRSFHESRLDRQNKLWRVKVEGLEDRIAELEEANRELNRALDDIANALGALRK